MEVIEDEEVIVKNTELGKFWSSPDMAASVPYEIFPDNQEASSVDMDYSDETLNEDSTSPPVKYSFTSSNASDTEGSDDANHWIFIDSEAIRNRFTRENRLASNSKHLNEKLAELSNILDDISSEALDLFEAKEDALKKAAIVDTLTTLKYDFRSKVSAINNLISFEELLLQQLTFVPDEEESTSLTLPETISHNLTEQSLPETVQESSNVSEDPHTFETGSSYLETTEEVVGQDEIYETNENMSDIFACNLNDTIVEVVEDEFACAQRTVLDELKTTLLPRRVDMVNREREAFIRAYGFEPPQVDETEQSVNIRPKSKKYRPYGSPPLNIDQSDVLAEKFEEFRPIFLDNPNSPYYNAKCSDQETMDSKVEEMSANFDDDSVVEEDSVDLLSKVSGSQRSNFFAVLESTLDGPRSKIPGGIVPIYKREEPANEADESDE